MTILVTGSAGFIGFHLIKKLYNNISNIEVVGVDNFNDYYDVNLKNKRSNILHNSFQIYIEILNNCIIIRNTDMENNYEN